MTRKLLSIKEVYFACEGTSRSLFAGLRIKLLISNKLTTWSYQASISIIKVKKILQICQKYDFTGLKKCHALLKKNKPHLDQCR